MPNKQASKGIMKVSVNKETKYLLNAALTNVTAHLYFTLLVYPLYSEKSLGKQAILLSLLSALTWVYAAKRRLYRALLTLVPLTWLISFYHAFPSHQSMNQQYSSELVLIDPSHHSQLAPMLKPSYLLPALVLLMAYFFLTLLWIRISQESDSDRVNEYYYRDRCRQSISEMTSDQNVNSLQVILPKLIKFLPMYWGVVLCLSYYVWADYSTMPSGVDDISMLPTWLSLFVGLATVTVFMASALITLRLAPVSYLVLERSGLLKINLKWRKYVWVMFIMSLLLMYTELV